MRIWKKIFGKREKWTELNTLYSAGRMESICSYLADHGIPYKVRAALLPVVTSIGTMGQSVWYLSVHPDDVGKVYHYLRQEKMG